MELPNRIFLITLSLSVLMVIFSTGFMFLWQKKYNFIVEAACTPSSNNCFHRDCGEFSDCPPNALEDYRVFVVSAVDFNKCGDDSCVRECTTGSFPCLERFCSEQKGETCLSFEKKDSSLTESGVENFDPDDNSGFEPDGRVISF